MTGRSLPLLPSVVVAGIFVFLPKKHVSNKPRDIHPVFFKMREKGISILSDFRFDRKDGYLYSTTLAKACSSLLGSGAICYCGRNWEKYECGSFLRNYFESSVKSSLSEKQMEEMKQVANALKRFCS